MLIGSIFGIVFTLVGFGFLQAMAQRVRRGEIVPSWYVTGLVMSVGLVIVSIVAGVEKALTS